MRRDPNLASKLATLAALAESTGRRGNGNGDHPAPQRRIPLGMVIVELQAMKRKYSELERNREAFRAQLATQKPGAYDGYKVVQVKEVTVHEHVRRAHKRVLLPR